MTSNVGIYWGAINTETPLINYIIVPTTDNNGSTSTGSNSYGCLPSDIFTGVTSYVDSKAKYNDSTPYTPSPYLGETPNSEYYKMLDGNNAFSDFNGLQNTNMLVALSSGYLAANIAWNYKDDYSNIQWYLPGMGELGYIMPRINEINNSINSLNGATIDESYLWSSSEYNSSYVYKLTAFNGNVSISSKDNKNISIRPFAII